MSPFAAVALAVATAAVAVDKVVCAPQAVARPIPNLVRSLAVWSSRRSPNSAPLAFFASINWALRRFKSRCRRFF